MAKVIGIDLGTTNSLVSTSSGQDTEVLPDDAGKYLLPSVVQYSAEVDPVVGKIAIAAAINDPKNTISSVKRLLGRSIEEVLAAPQFKHYDLYSLIYSLLSLLTLSLSLTNDEAMSTVIKSFLIKLFFCTFVLTL